MSIYVIFCPNAFSKNVRNCFYHFIMQCILSAFSGFNIAGMVGFEVIYGFFRKNDFVSRRFVDIGDVFPFFIFLGNNIVFDSTRQFPTQVPPVHTGIFFFDSNHRRWRVEIDGSIGNRLSELDFFRR